VTRRQVARAEALPPTDAASALIVVAVLLTLMWWLVPYGLILALPVAHVALVASMAKERWQLAGLGFLALLPFLLSAASIGSMIDRGFFYSAWYLLVTSVSGTRGWLGPLLAVLIGVCLWTVAAPAFHGRRSGSTSRRGPKVREAAELDFQA
jgi:hypothetical protein